MTQSPAKTRLAKGTPHLDLAYFKKALVALTKKQLSRRQLAEEVGITYITAGKWINLLHEGPDNLIYISAWRKHSSKGPFTEYFSFGYMQPDVPKPALARSKEARLARKKKLAGTQIYNTPIGIVRRIT